MDNGVPGRSNTPVLTVNIDRNRNAPVFQQELDQVRIADNLNLGDQITAVTAVDADTIAPYNQVRYFNVAGQSSDFFFINEDTAMVYLSGAIADDAHAFNQYTQTIGDIMVFLQIMQ